MPAKEEAGCPATPPAILKMRAGFLANKKYVITKPKSAGVDIGGSHLFPCVAAQLPTLKRLRTYSDPTKLSASDRGRCSAAKVVSWSSMSRWKCPKDVVRRAVPWSSVESSLAIFHVAETFSWARFRATSGDNESNEETSKCTASPKQEVMHCWHFKAASEHAPRLRIFRFGSASDICVLDRLGFFGQQGYNKPA